MKLLFAFGAGYSVTALARALAGSDWRVIGTNRAPADADAAYGPAPIERVAWSSGALWPAAAKAADALLFSAPPDEAGDPALAQRPDGVRAEWAGYLSSASVYGDRRGAWVDEDSPLRPASVQGLRRAAAEVQARASGLPMHIFRLPGIYGPGRSAFEKLSGTDAFVVDKPGHVFSRIHVDDLAAVLIASLERPNPGRIYNVADDRPAEQSAVLRYAARLAGLAPPSLRPYDPEALGPGRARFYGECRRLANARMKAELGVRLRFADFEAGLTAIRAGTEARATGEAS